MFLIYLKNDESFEFENNSKFLISLNFVILSWIYLKCLKLKTSLDIWPLNNDYNSDKLWYVLQSINKIVEFLVDFKKLVLSRFWWGSSHWTLYRAVQSRWHKMFDLKIIMKINITIEWLENDIGVLSLTTI